MRITRKMLDRVIQDTISQRSHMNRSLISVYLTGSLLEDQFLLGGTTDVDLVFIHTGDIPQPREIVSLTEDVHLDISHHLRRDYRNTRDLRVHPWMGPTIFRCQIVYDPQHFMDFTQASVRGQFYSPEHVLDRARSQAEHARQIWFGYYGDPPDGGPEEVSLYLKAVDHAVNAVASLSGPPLTERRYLLNFPQRAQAVERPGLVPGLLGLLGAPEVDLEQIRSWLPGWQTLYESAPADLAQGRLHPARQAYYLRAFEALLGSGSPEAVIWPLLRTWTLAANQLAQGDSQLDGWSQALEALGLAGEGFGAKLAALDAFLDLVDETLDEWARKNGVG